MVGDKTRVGGNKNKTNSAGRKKESRITGELRKKSSNEGTQVHSVVSQDCGAFDGEPVLCINGSLWSHGTKIPHRKQKEEMKKSNLLLK